MQTSVTFKNLDPSDSLKSYVQDKLGRFDRYLDNPAMATIVLSVEKFRRIAEINITGDRLSIKGKEETEDMYSAIDMVLDKLEKQIKKNRQKIRQRRGGPKTGRRNEFIDEAYMSVEKPARQIRIKNIDYKPMDVDEATLQMDITTNNFLVFINSKTDRVNVLYRRKDGDYGLIQPNP